MTVLGLINLLGSWGNHVFFMISGFFLIPSLAASSRQFGYWRSQIVPTSRRCAVVVISVLLYGCLALMINAWIMPLPGAGSRSWWGMGLEFVWLYLCFVALAPIIGWVVERMGSRKAEFLSIALICVVYGLNAYIAFVSQGEVMGRGLGDWRKLMSAVSYLLSFTVAGLIGKRIRDTSVGGIEPKTLQWWRRPKLLLTGACLVGAVAWLLSVLTTLHGRYDLLYALSFKSTSLISFVLALLALLFCSSLQLSVRFAAKARARMVLTLAPGILGFYIAQSLMHAVWFIPCFSMMSRILGRVAGNARLTPVATVLVFFTFGVIFAVLFAAVLCGIDRVLRRPILKMLRLAK
jgi:hypothetical protein